MLTKDRHMTPFIFNTTKTIVFASGVTSNLAQVTGSVLGEIVLLVTDPGIRDLGLAEPAIASLRTAGNTVVMFDTIEADPSLETLMRAVEFGHTTGVTGVLGFGGGSSLDVAKLVALLLGSNENLDDAWGVNQAKGPRLPLVLVPTTAGTGSEVTPVAIITVGAEEKRGVSSPIILPDIAILDADLTLGLPSLITATTGVDSMVHAIEAFSSRSSNNNPLSKLLASEALHLLGANIKTAVFSGQNRAARSGMILGAMLAGQAFANSPVAAVHALAYPIGSTFHIPHGLSNALVLPHVMRFNAPNAHRQYSEIATAVFPKLAEIKGTHARCDAFIEALAALSKELGMATRLRDVDIPQSALVKLSTDAMLQTRLLVNNPRVINENDALEIYKAAW